MENKHWWTSKTLWVNIISVAAIVYAGYTGKVENVETWLARGLPIVNILLRLVTKQPLGW